MNNNVNIEREIWDFGDTLNISDSSSVCSTAKSGNSLVKFRDVNIISHNPPKRNIDNKLKIIREVKHEEYRHNAGRKSLTLANNKNKKNSK